MAIKGKIVRRDDDFDFVMMVRYYIIFLVCVVIINGGGWGPKEWVHWLVVVHAILLCQKYIRRCMQS